MTSYTPFRCKLRVTELGVTNEFSHTWCIKKIMPPICESPVATKQQYLIPLEQVTNTHREEAFLHLHKCWHILIFVLGGKYPSVLTFVTHIVTHAYCQELLQNWSDPVYMFNCRLLLSFASWGKASGQKSCSVLSNMITADLMCYCFYTGWQFA